MENERYDAYKNPEVEQLLTKIVDKKTEITPVFDLEFGYRYPDVEEWLKKKPKESREFLERLARVGILERKLYTKELRCPKCKGSNIDTNYVCPFCKSIDVERDALIEHLACGFIDVLSNFKSDGDYVCPKCHSKLDLGSYRAAGSWYACASCGKRVEFPTPQHKCRSCETRFNLDSAIYEKVYVYSLSQIARDAISNGIFLRSAIAERATAVGYNVEAPYLIRGNSGVEHTFDMLLTMQDAKMVVDIILSDSPISQLDIIKEYTKVIDTGTTLHLIAIPKLNEDAKKLAVFYKVNVIESDSPEEALEVLTKFLASEKEKRTLEKEPPSIVAEVTEKEEKAEAIGEPKKFNAKSLFRRRK